ncbi:hypothetical protein TSMG0098 [Halocynthia phage JM-2012]|uniref:hypothetical protein n=1 Tax=Halocynthia phage JM-2012 TaxID=1173297 RepID=UPI00025C6936|nr:hypothetical protein TSMG0098 [Halocynthia phage JM-2012]AFI55381.1 hypothetical protein TSMG0098 [Halocynthia phage JM-2012]
MNISKLSVIQKDYLWVTLSLIFINTFLIAYTIITYINIVGSQGMVIKEYLVSAFGLILVLPYIGRMNKAYPIRCLKVAIVLEVGCMLGYTYVSFNPEAIYVLFISTFALVCANILSRSMNTKVGSYVVAGCDDYSNLITSYSALCTGVCSLIGLVLMYYEVNVIVVLVLLNVSILVSRHYKLKVFKVVYA